MNKLYILVAIGVVLLGVVAFWYFTLWSDTSMTTLPDPEPEPVPATTATEVAFISPQTGEMATVNFVDSGATMTYQEYVEVFLTPVVAASGARYENADLGLALWNKGAEITIYQDDVVVFIGQTEASLGDPNPGAVDVVANALQSHPWTWMKTQMSDGAEVVPNQAGAFVLTFTAEGAVSGQTDCNSFGGSYTMEDGVVTMGQFMMTLKYCEGSQEADFQSMLTGPLTTRFTDAGELILEMPDEQGTIVFEPVL